jgi:DNA-binding Lrp family transcriptional regulator
MALMRSDELDQRIIAYLAHDGRAAYAVVGEAVGLSASAVKRRVDRLLATGEIHGFTVAIDPQRLAGPLEAFVELSCIGNVPASRLRAMIAGVPQVRAGFSVTGDADALLHVVTDDMASFEQVLERLRDEPGVARTRTTIVLSRL